MSIFKKPVEKKEVVKEKLLAKMNEELDKCGGLISNLPHNSDYWKFKNQLNAF